MSRDVEVPRSGIGGVVRVFGARLPVDAAQRGWVDRSLAELTVLFGPAGRWPTVLPTADYFPAAFDRSPRAVRELVDRVCGWVHVDPADVDLDVFFDPADDDAPPPAGVGVPTRTVAGDYTRLPDGRGLVGIHHDSVGQPLTLVATVAHELAHHLLTGRGHVAATPAENEGLTDLLTTHLGLGILTANAQHQHRTDHGGGWSSTTLGYLSSQTYGYALACRAVGAGEPDPPWVRYLAPNPRGHLRSSLRVLTRPAAPGHPPTSA